MIVKKRPLKRAPIYIYIQLIKQKLEFEFNNLSRSKQEPILLTDSKIPLKPQVINVGIWSIVIYDFFVYFSTYPLSPLS